MNKIIKDILDKNISNDKKLKELNLISDDIEVAKGIFSGKYTYCPECDDYYLSKSFLTDVESEKTRICTWEDPINSGGNEYVEGYLDITYSICPKGHKHIISQKERR